MASNNMTPLGDHINAEQAPVAANTQDQVLLEALKDFIVRVAAPERKNDTNQTSLGPEAGNFLTALKEFIASILQHSQPGAQNMIEVDRAEEAIELQRDSDDDKGDENMELYSGADSSPRSSYSDFGGDESSEDNDNPMVRHTLHKTVDLSFQDKLLKGLHEHVFNMMPIRLLCFEPHATSLQIVMLERGAIYSRLALAVQTDFYRKDQRLPLYRRRTETEKEAIYRVITKYYARYAILSHTWLRTASGEVTYSDWNKGILDTEDPGYQKLVNFCRTAWKDNRLTFGWMDTICINKDSSSELDESIRSMYNWYARADVCFVYLAQTGSISTMHFDPWFTRGWTLQELLAPSIVMFYDQNWNRIVDNSGNDKEDPRITNQIKRATTISKDELNDIGMAPISRRMQLAATREVTREEDTAYSLMGIFNVSMSTAYGEGAERAFFRLLQQILDSSTHNILDIFNWAGELPDSRPHRSQILPTSPEHYLRRSTNAKLQLLSPIEPLALTHLGMRVPVILMPAMATPFHYDSIGDYNGTACIVPVSVSSKVKGATTCNILDSRVFDPDGPGVDNDSAHISFAVLNFYGDATNIWIPKTCIAIALECSEEAGKVYGLEETTAINTVVPIVFELGKKIKARENTSANGGDDSGYDLFYNVSRDKLATHGMQLVTLYL